MPDIPTWLSKFPQLVANPGDIQTLALQQVEETYKGTADITDPSNPFILNLEASAVNAAGAILSYEAYTRRLYGIMALTQEDLYVHMSDVDYLDRFAIPSNATFHLYLNTDELLASMIDTRVNGIKQITIPRFTSFTVNGTTFTMQYPIDIRQKASGGLSLTYNTDQLSPVQTLATNLVNWSPVTIKTDGVVTPFIQIALPMRQFAIQSQLATVNYSTGLAATYPYTDQFYYARAYSVDAVTGVETEILTTHTNQDFDPLKPTLLLKDLGGSLQISLPQIYLTSKSVGGEVRVDIYTTKGDISLAMDAYSPDSFLIQWLGGDTSDSKYVAPLLTFKTLTVYSTDTTTGGSNGMDFPTLRNQVLLNNFGPINTPITPSQLSGTLLTLGYQPVIDVDNVTDRIVLATRALPAPVSGLISSGASMTIETFVTTLAALSSFATVQNNGLRSTILPTTLFSLVNGQVSIVPDSQVTALRAMATDALVRAINAANYLYTPFHYVLDNTNNLFALRAYYLDNPLANSIQFVMENVTVGIDVGTQDKEIIRTPTGYRLRVQCQSSAAWKALSDADVYCQLAFIPEGEKTYAYMNGTLITTQNNERIFEFDITTNYDVDSQDDLVLTSFQMYNDSARLHASPLTGDFDIFWIAAGVSNAQTNTTQIDLDMGVALLPTGVLGIARERINLTLGSALGGLWRRSRTVAGSGIYQTYSANVIQTYTTDVYATDPSTGNVVLTSSNGVVNFTYLHRAGDPVLDANGNPVIAHHTGDQVLGSDGKPILISTGTLQHQLDLLMVEGAFFFASSTDATTYKATIAPTLVNWITNDLGSVVPRLLEKTELFFYPKATLGDVQVLVSQGNTLTIQAAQTFNLTYYLDNTAWRDPTLRAPLTQIGIQTIATALQNKTVSMMDLTATLKASVGSDVAGFDLTGLGGNLNLSTMTIIDDSQRLSIRKEAIVEADGTIGLQDGVSVSFIQHDTTASLNGTL